MQGEERERIKAPYIGGKCVHDLSIKVSSLIFAVACDELALAVLWIICILAFLCERVDVVSTPFRLVPGI